jgi:hypothetical protein
VNERLGTIEPQLTLEYIGFVAERAWGSTRRLPSFERESCSAQSNVVVGDERHRETAMQTCAISHSRRSHVALDTIDVTLTSQFFGPRGDGCSRAKIAGGHDGAQ